MDGVLKNITVIDLSQNMSGPLCPMILGELGADVIKVEPPEGDAARRLGETFLHGESLYILYLNRNKRSIVINLKTEEGRHVFYQLAGKADIVVENFRPGVVQKLKVDYETLSKLNPGIIYCSVSGFGQKGPYASRPALDAIIEAISGHMSLTGDNKSAPLKAGVPICDILTPLFSTIGVLGALYERQKSGVGQKLEISMLDAGVFSLIPRDAYYFINGRTPPRLGNQVKQVVPHNTFGTKDGKYVMVIAHTEKYWINLCEDLGRNDLISDPRFKTNLDRDRNSAELYKILGQIFIGKTQREWVASLSGDRILIAPVNSLEQVYDDPQIQENDLVRELNHPVAGKLRAVRLPVNYLRTPAHVSRPSPTLGEHTDEILQEAGFTKEEIERLKERGSVNTRARERERC